MHSAPFTGPAEHLVSMTPRMEPMASVMRSILSRRRRVRGLGLPGVADRVSPRSETCEGVCGAGIAVATRQGPVDRAQPDHGDAAHDWLCVWCLNRVASEKDRFTHGGRSEFRFANPDGIRFDILTFARAVGGQPTGTPTLEHTWFPGHAWSYCLCGQCGRHLGWYYTGPAVFVGLIRDRIVRAAVMRN